LRGEGSLAETIEQVKIRTRQFAKRQLTWFRRQLDPEWIELKPGESLEMAVANLQREIVHQRSAV
jgi:tRNA dimethylallyltransferase